MSKTIENIKKHWERKCENCTYCCVKYVENGTKSYCGINGKEVNPNTQTCGIHSVTNWGQ